MGVFVVPQGEIWIQERFGKFYGALEAGLHFSIPGVDHVSYKHLVKEVAFPISSQTAITRDNVQIEIDGVVYIRITDVEKASYQIEHPYSAVSNLAQTTMRSEIGMISLDKTFSGRQKLNESIVNSIEKTTQTWGIKIERYEIKDITVPMRVQQAMEYEAEAERRKRKTELDAEAQKRKDTLVAEGKKNAMVLQSEAQRIEIETIAMGEAFQIRKQAEALADSISVVAKSLCEPNGEKAVSLKIAEKQVEAFSKIAKEGNTIIVPSNLSDTSSLVASSLSIFDNLNKKQKKEPISQSQALNLLTQEVKKDNNLAQHLKEE